MLIVNLLQLDAKVVQSRELEFRPFVVGKVSLEFFKDEGERDAVSH